MKEKNSISIPNCSLPLRLGRNGVPCVHVFTQSPYWLFLILIIYTVILMHCRSKSSAFSAWVSRNVVHTEASMVVVANKGYRAIDIDFRGYGLSEQPADPEKSTFKDLVADVVSLLDSFAIDKAFLIGKYFGPLPAYLIPALHPEQVCGVITLGIPIIQPGPSAIQNHLLPEGFYITRCQELGRAEADFGRFDVKSVARNIYILLSGSEVPVAAADQEIMDLFDPAIPLPPWFSEEDLEVYASLYERSGFRFPLQSPYRTIGLDYGLTDPKVSAPSLLIMGEKDYLLKFPWIEDYIRTGAVKDFVPNLDIIYIPEGRHFVQEQLPDQVNQLIINFLDKHAA